MRRRLAAGGRSAGIGVARNCPRNASRTAWMTEFSFGSLVELFIAVSLRVRGFEGFRQTPHAT